MAETKKNENLFQRIGNWFKRTAKAIGKWFRGMRSELKKVVWPSWSQLMNNTLVVIVSSLVIAAIIFVFDYIANLGVSTLLRLVG